MSRALSPRYHWGELVLVTVYCSGSIPKGPTDTRRAVWTDAERAEIAQSALPIDIRFLRPDDPVAGLDDAVAMFGRDMYQVQIADFVVVDARDRRGIGIGVEMLASRLLGTSLIIVAPRDSHYRRDELQYRGGTVSDYIHPHIRALADTVVESFAMAGEWIREFCSSPRQVKDIGAVYEAISAYKRDVLHLDQPMVQLMLELEEIGKSVP